MHLREQADPRAPDILSAPHSTMQGGSELKSDSTQECKVWMGSGRGARDADNVWCPVQYGIYRGWANAYLLAQTDGRRVACVLYPDAKGCSAKVRHDRPCDVAQDHPEKFNWNPEGGNAIMFGECGEVEDISGIGWPSRAGWWGAIRCGYFAYRENKKREASPIRTST